MAAGRSADAQKRTPPEAEDNQRQPLNRRDFVNGLDIPVNRSPTEFDAEAGVLAAACKAKVAFDGRLRSNPKTTRTAHHQEVFQDHPHFLLPAPGQ